MKIDIRQIITCCYCGGEIDIETYGWGFVIGSGRYYHNECLQENEDVPIA